MTTAAVDTTLGELLSPSQVNTFLSCAAKWYFRYALGLAEPPTGTLALGTAFHSVLAADFRQKIETKQDLPAQELEESFGEAFAIAAENAEFREDEEPVTLVEIGRALVRKYMDDAAAWIQPKAVELAVEGMIAGVRVQGIVDLLDMEGRIIGRHSFLDSSAEFPLAFAPVPAIPSGNRPGCWGAEIDSVPHGFLRHRVKRLRIPAFSWSNLATLLHQLRRLGLGDGVQSAGAARARRDHRVRRQLQVVLRRDPGRPVRRVLAVDT